MVITANNVFNCIDFIYNKFAYLMFPYRLKNTLSAPKIPDRIEG